MVTFMTLSARPAFDLSDNETLEIGVEAWTYLFPLVLMELTRRVMSNVIEPDGITLRSPMGEFAHASRFPDASFRDVVRPNADTLYSMLWYDVGSEPLVLIAPESPDRYHVLPLMDMWTEVFASVGSYATAGRRGNFAIVGPRWAGHLPDGMRPIRSPTDAGWILGRIQANGPTDFPSLRSVQSQIRTAPLSRFGQKSREPARVPNPDIDMVTPPVDQAMALPASVFFPLAASLMKRNPPHASDVALLMRLERIGFVAGEDFSLEAMPAGAGQALERAVVTAQSRMMKNGMARRLHKDGWVLPAVLGVYGNEYLSRAFTAFRGLGALPPTEALYPTALADGQGRPLEGGSRYQLHFPVGAMPPAKAFWSLTMYGADQFFVENPINRFAIGDRDALKFNPDGSLDLWIQNESPGADRETNWLPAPLGPFSMNMRLYEPAPEAVNGQWNAPPLRRLA